MFSLCVWRQSVAVFLCACECLSLMGKSTIRFVSSFLNCSAVLFVYLFVRRWPSTCAVCVYRLLCLCLVSHGRRAHISSPPLPLAVLQLLRLEVSVLHCCTVMMVARESTCVCLFAAFPLTGTAGPAQSAVSAPRCSHSRSSPSPSLLPTRVPLLFYRSLLLLLPLFSSSSLMCVVCRCLRRRSVEFVLTHTTSPLTCLCCVCTRHVVSCTSVFRPRCVIIIITIH